KASADNAAFALPLLVATGGDCLAAAVFLAERRRAGWSPVGGGGVPSFGADFFVLVLAINILLVSELNLQHSVLGNMGTASGGVKGAGSFFIHTLAGLRRAIGGM